ncbi:MAG: DUF4184 family protein [Microthrixaceae bacterium]
MPATFPAHQAPVLPLKMWYPDRWDGLALVVGSIMPDLWYVTVGWRGYVGFGQPKWVDGHQIAMILQCCLLPGMLLTVVLRRVVAPVVPAVLPGLGMLRLRDHRLTALSRHRLLVTFYSVLVGTLSHLVLDAFTHRDGVFVNGGPLSGVVATIAGVDVTGYRLLQFVGHVVGSIAALAMLVVIARRRLMWRWHGFEARPPDQRVSLLGRVAVISTLCLGAVVAVAYGASRTHDGGVVGFIAGVDVMLVVSIVAGLVGRPLVGPVEAPTTAANSPASFDPLVE